MNGAELKDVFRLDAFDNVEPYLWSDDEIYRFADDAQNMFCRLVGGISDTTSSITSITAKAANEFTAIDHRILKIRLARRQTDYVYLDVVDFEDTIEPGAQVTDRYAPSNGNPGLLDGATGTPQMMVVNMEPNKVRWVPIPVVDTAVRLTVYRMPLNAVCKDNKDQPLEIDSRHQFHLLKWMKHLAFAKQDAETFDRAKSLENQQLFMNYCDLAKREKERREHKYGRSVAYGGL